MCWAFPVPIHHQQLVFEQPSSRPAKEHKKEPTQFLFHTRLFYPNTVTDTVPLPAYDPLTPFVIPIRLLCPVYAYRYRYRRRSDTPLPYRYTNK
jgi:hypothetical protein